MKHIKWFHCIGIFMLLSLGACQSYLYDQHVEVDVNGWKEDAAVTFEFDITDNSFIHNVIIDIEHSTEYNFANLYTKTIVHFPDGNKREEILSFELADKLGTWYGECSGTSCTHKLAFMQNAVFDKNGTYKIVISPYNRQENIAGIEGFRLYVEQTEQQVKNG